MEAVTGFRPVAINVGVRDLEEAITFYEAVFEATFEVSESRAVAAGAKEHFPPVEEPGLPRHSRFADPSGNRVVLWQA